MYSDMSKRISSTPSAIASWRVTSVLPTPVGPANRKEPTGARHLDRCSQRLDGRILAVDDQLQVALEIAQRVLVVGRDVLRRYARDARHHVLDHLGRDEFFALAFRLEPQSRARLVDDVDGLVRQLPVVDVPRRQLSCRDQRIIRILDAVVLLEASPQTLEDVHRLLHRRLGNVDLLEAPRECVVLLEDAAVFGVGGRADAAQLAIGERRLDQVRGVHDAARGSAGADHRVDLVDEQDRAGVLLQLAEYALQALLEIAAILGAGDQRAHVERVDGAVAQDFRDLVFDDHARQAFDQRGLANASFADVQRVVFATAAQDLHRALDLQAPADQRIDAPFHRQLVQIGRELLQRRAAVRLAALALGAGCGLVVLVGTVPILDLRQAVGDVVDDIETRDVLHRQQVGRMRVLLAEDRDQHVRGRDFLLAARLDVEHGALQDALEAQRRLNLAIVVVLEPWRGLIDEVFQVLA
jgi:hypothetical protein